MHNPSVLFHSEGRITLNVLLWPKSTLYQTGLLVSHCSVTVLKNMLVNLTVLYFMWLGFLVDCCWVLLTKVPRNRIASPSLDTVQQFRGVWNCPCLKWRMPSLKEKI